eukprot:XP_020399774.1 uncharacterized protein LOC109942292 [Zea mays]
MPPPPRAVAGSPPHRGLLHAASARARARARRGRPRPCPPRPPSPAPAPAAPSLAGARTRRALPRRRPSPRRRPPVPRRDLARRLALALSLSRAAAAPATPSADHARPLHPRPRPTASVPLARPRVPSMPSAAARPLRRCAPAPRRAPATNAARHHRRRKPPPRAPPPPPGHSTRTIVAPTREKKFLHGYRRKILYGPKRGSTDGCCEVGWSGAVSLTIERGSPRPRRLDLDRARSGSRAWALALGGQQRTLATHVHCGVGRALPALRSPELEGGKSGATGYPGAQARSGHRGSSERGGTGVLRSIFIDLASG